MRQIILDTETTGLEPGQGHRIIEIGCVELVNRRQTQRQYHQYLNPERLIDAGAMEVHGISNETLADKPKFAEIVQEFIEFVRGAELIIHNAPFDVGFINAELTLLGKQWGRIEDYCEITDTLALARKLSPGKRCSLDELCKRYEVDNSQRTLHGALLDAVILLDVYLAMTSGQETLLLDTHAEELINARRPREFDHQRPPLKLMNVPDAEQMAHEQRLDQIEQGNGGICVWRQPLAGQS